MNDPYLILLMLATAVFFAAFFFGLHNIFDGVAHKCWHKWGYWGVDETSDVITQVRRCTKCGYVQMEQHIKIKGSEND
jgi:ribosomal protein S27AE